MYSYLDEYERSINNQKFICIRILYDDFDKHIHTIISVYKPYDKETVYKLENYSAFDDVTEHIGFKVKSDGKCHITFEI